MAGGYKKIKPEDGKQFSSDYQPEEKWTEEKATELGEELIKWLTDKDNEGNIFFEEFIVIQKDLYPSLIAYLSKKYSSFSKLIEKAKKIQEIKLYKYGVADRLNAAMAKFVLINEHGKLSDRSKGDITSDGDKMENTVIILPSNNRE